jgi:hypothetical protein
MSAALKTFNPSGVGKPARVVLQTFNPSGVDVCVKYVNAVEMFPDDA